MEKKQFISILFYIFYAQFQQLNPERLITLMAEMKFS